MSTFKFEVWPTEFRSITQPFGVNPEFYRRFGLPAHEGVDFMAPNGSKIFAVADGRVIQVHTNPDARVHAYGIHLTLRHEDNYETIYAHLQEIRVHVGQAVRAGQIIALGNNTGNSSGPHLHLTLKKIGGGLPGWPNHIIDPTRYILPHLGWQEPAGPFTEGWAFTAAITVHGNLAQVNAGGISLRSGPSRTARLIKIVPEGTMMLVNGAARTEYTPVRVPSAAIGVTPPAPPPLPEEELAPTIATIEGWGWTQSLLGAGNRTVVAELGINLRAAPDRNATNIGLVAGGSTVAIRGAPQGEYTPVRVSQADFIGPINRPEAGPSLPPGPVVQPPANSFLGWGHTASIAVSDRQAVVHPFGITLRSQPAPTAAPIGVVKGMSTVAVAGLPRGQYTPVVARAEDVLNLAAPLPPVTQPDPLPDEAPRLPVDPQPTHDTTPGWAFTAGIILSGNSANVGSAGINLRREPRRDADNLGFVPPDTALIVMGLPQGEYTPVRVDDNALQPSFQIESISGDARTFHATDPDPEPLGRAQIGLHASADPGDLKEAEFAEFAAMRPGIIKVLSGHSAASIARLCREHPNAAWIVRAFLHFGGRNITPDQFLADTISDVKRSLDELRGHDVVIELHNEPNLIAEGLGDAWSDGGRFGAWFSELLSKYRRELPQMRFIYPGLSPGGTQPGVRVDHVQFLEASRAAVENSDGLGVHIYWDTPTSAHPMQRGLAVLDDTINRFRGKPVWVTEASNNQGRTLPAVKAREYLTFWQELQKRPTVQGVTYFVSSASDPDFQHEIWVGRGIGRIIGQR